MKRIKLKRKVIAGLVLFVFVFISTYYALEARDSLDKPKVTALPVHPRADPRAPRILEKKAPKNPFLWTLPDNLKSTGQYDPDLIKEIGKWLVPPSTGPKTPKELSRGHLYSQQDEAAFVDGLLKQRSNAVFIEAGAYDGDQSSTTLYFERSRNWSGLLVEANPYAFQSLLKLNRHAYSINTCLSPEPRPMSLEFIPLKDTGGLVAYMADSQRKIIQNESQKLNIVTMRRQCLPLYSILKAANISRVDYLSLDVEGAELEILKTFPFDEMRVEVISVDYSIDNDQRASEVKKQRIKEILVGKYKYKEEPFASHENIIFSKGLQLPRNDIR